MKKQLWTVTKKQYVTTLSGIDVVIKPGTIVKNKTASGYDNNYHFVDDTHNLVTDPPEAKNWSTFKHDFEYYGIDVPAKYCKPYKNHNLN